MGPKVAYYRYMWYNEKMAEIHSRNIQPSIGFDDQRHLVAHILATADNLHAHAAPGLQREVHEQLSAPYDTALDKGRATIRLSRVLLNGALSGAQLDVAAHGNSTPYALHLIPGDPGLWRVLEIGTSAPDGFIDHGDLAARISILSQDINQKNPLEALMDGYPGNPGRSIDDQSVVELFASNIRRLKRSRISRTTLYDRTDTMCHDQFDIPPSPSINFPELATETHTQLVVGQPAGKPKAYRLSLSTTYDLGKLGDVGIDYSYAVRSPHTRSNELEEPSAYVRVTGSSSSIASPQLLNDFAQRAARNDSVFNIFTSALDRLEGSITTTQSAPRTRRTRRRSR